MPPARRTYCAIRLLFLSLLALVPISARAALPPLLEAKPLFGDALVQGRWQPVVVTVTNQDGGNALTGEITTGLRDAATSEVFGSWITPITLPRGSGTARTVATVFVPENDQPDLFISLRQGRDGRGQVVTQRTLDKLRFAAPSLTLLAVTTIPDAVSYLRGEKLGVENSTGVLRPAANVSSAGQKNQSFGQRTITAASEVRVENLADAGQLPVRAAGYGTIGIIYLGPDIGPAQFSDSQVSALRGWVTGGGLLVTGSPSLRSDERFRTWVPITGQARIAGIDTGRAHVGRGMAVSVAADLAETGFGRSQAGLDFWRTLARQACSEPLIGNLVQGLGLSYYYPEMEFWQSVIRAPGLKAPPSSAIALFLLTYLLLLVPINYFILKRLDRREWTWATVPILVTLFSVGAYVFGYAIKGTRMLQNTVTLCEMGANRGDAVVTASVGIFSPRQAKYDLSTSYTDAIFWSPQNSNRYNRRSQEYGELEVALPGDTGNDSEVHVRNANISMWAMRAFAARTYQVRMGRGIAAKLSYDDRRLTGSVTNNTGRPLEEVSVMFGGGRADIRSLGPGETRELSMAMPPGGKRRMPVSQFGFPGMSGLNSHAQEFQRPVLNSVRSALNSFSEGEQAQGIVRNAARTALLVAWNQEEIFPIRIDGKSIPTGQNLNLITVTIPVEGK